jgi:hypothetical protein
MPISFLDLSWAATANPRKEGVIKSTSAKKEKKESADLILSVIAEKIKGADDVITKTGHFKPVFKLSKVAFNKMNAQNVVGSVPIGFSAIVTRPEILADDSCILFGKPKGVKVEKSNVFRANTLVAYLKSTGQLDVEFGKNEEDKAYFNVVNATAEIEGLPDGFSWYNIVKKEDTVDSELAPTTVSDAVSVNDVAQVPVAEHIGETVGEDESLEDGDEDEEEEDPFA